MATFFPFAEYWWLYAAFTGGVLLLLFVDLFVLHRDAHEVRFREALGWSAAWVTLALLFNAGLYAYALWRFPQDPRLTAIMSGERSLRVARTCALRWDARLPPPEPSSSSDGRSPGARSIISRKEAASSA